VPATYIGEFNSGKISGYGVWSLDSGERFEGEFLDNIYNVPKLDPKEKVDVAELPPAPMVITGATMPARCAKPDYPSASLRLKQEGTVTLRVLIEVDGSVLQTAIDKTSGFNRLDEAARKALSKCQFQPATVNGKAEKSWSSMKYIWRLQ
jgi:protein TonB